jgi:hypothetical protein
MFSPILRSQPVTNQQKEVKKGTFGAFHKALADTDLLCSVPMMKTHGLATVTLGMKNLIAFLLSNEPGKAFVAWYYRHSPKYAAIIGGRPALRALTRTLLLPFYALAFLCLQGLFASAAALSIVFTTVACLWFKKRRDR